MQKKPYKNLELYKEALDIMETKKCSTAKACEIVSVDYSSFMKYLKKTMSCEEYESIKSNKVRKVYGYKSKSEKEELYKKALKLMQEEKCSQGIAAFKMNVCTQGLRNWLIENLGKAEYEKLKHKTLRKTSETEISKKIENKFKERFNHKRKIYNIEIMDWAIKNDISIPVIEFKPIIISMGKEFVQC